jgi:methylmalonyl-CoA mutase N-terminal domain/subunit
VGVNDYVQDKVQIPIQLIDPEVERLQQQRLAQVRRERDPVRHHDALAALHGAAVNGQNTMPAFLACAHAYSTLGEQMDVLRKVFGEYVETAVL